MLKYESADTDAMHDVMIIGAGAAGLTAAIYTTRKQLSTLIISADVGGQTNLTSGIENYPGFKELPGQELMMKFKDQAESFGAVIKSGRAVKVEQGQDGLFTAHLEDGSAESARSVILAFGAWPRELGIPGEKKFLGRGVSTCATCDAPFFKKKTVAVIGGGNAAIEAVLELGAICERVHLVHRRSEFRADEVTVSKARGLKNASFHLDCVAVEIKGQKKVESLTVKDLKSGKEQDILLDGVFVEIGHVTDSSCVKGLVDLAEGGEVKVDLRQNTSRPGVFAAGDATTTPYKQTVIAAGQGAIAALEAHRYLTGGKTASADWSASNKKAR